MPKRHQQTKTKNTKARIIAGLCLVIACVVAARLLPGSSVKLNDDGYNLTIALYRVCNQQDEEGLLEIAVHLDQAIDANGGADPQQEALESIVQDARAGQWESAMRECRSLLEDQARR